MHQSINLEKFANTSKMKIACLSLVIFCAFLQACGRDLTDAEHLAKARTAFNQGNMTTAGIELKNALLINPENGQARLLLGETYLELDDAYSAEKELRKALEAGAPEHNVALPLSKALFLQRRFDEVVREFDVSNQMSASQQAGTLAIRGKSFLYQGHPDVARAEFERALGIDSQSTAAMLGLALTSRIAGDLESARQWVDSALEIDPQLAEGWDILGGLEESRGAWDKAEDAYGKAISASHSPAKYYFKRALLRSELQKDELAANDIDKLPRDNPGRYYAEGLIQFRQQKYEEAQASFETALSKYSDYAAAIYYLGLTHFMQGHDGQAEIYLNQFLEQFPESTSAANTMASLQIRSGDLDQAEALLNSVLERDANQPQALNLLAALALAQGKYEDAVEKYQQLVSMNPESATIRARLSLAMMARGDLDQGTTELEAAMALAPESDDFKMQLILSQLSAREGKMALASAERWVTVEPENVNANLLLAWTQLANKQHASARDTLTAVLELSPGNPSASHNLAMFAITSGNIKQAIAYYENSLMYYQDHPRINTYLAKLYRQQGQSEKAITLLTNFREEFPQDADSAAQLSAAYLDIGEAMLALAVIKDAAEEHPDDPAVLAALGAAQVDNGSYNAAVQTFEQLTALKPESARYQFLLARTYYEAGDRKQFSAALRQAYKMDPDNLDISIAMTSLLIAEAKLDEAQVIVNKLEIDYPQQLAVHIESARLSSARRQPEAAAQAWHNALELAPERSDLVVKYALALTQAGRQDEALQAMEDWLKVRPDDTVVRDNLANLCLLTGREDQARKLFKQMVTENPENVSALNNLAWLMRDSAPLQALEYAETANQLQPNSPPLMDTLAIILLTHPGQEARAIALLETVNEQAPNNPEFRFHLAQALARGGEQERAVALLTELLDGELPPAKRSEVQALLESL